jgi:V/A-type H+-transporting ATPase subunit I
LDKIDSQISPVLAKKEEAEQALGTNQAILSQLKDYLNFPVKSNSVYTFLEVSTGRIQEKNLLVLEKSLKDIPHVVYPFQKEGANVLTLVIALRRDRALLEKVLNDVSWQEIEYTKESAYLSRQAQDDLNLKNVQYRYNIKEAQDKIKQLAQIHQQELTRVNSFITLKNSILEARRYSCYTDKTILFSGWIPGRDKEKVISEIKNVADVSYVETKKAEQTEVDKEDIPVRLEHNPLVKPFELLIEAYGLPRYGTIDPTIFVAFSFLLMFGGMFGDLGHGLLLVAASLFMLRSKKEKVRQAGALIRYCGASSALFGFLYGSVFGFEFPAVWMKPMGNLAGIFRLSITLGVIMISLGVIINVVNSLRDKNYLKALFDKAGLIGGIVYWSAIALFSKMFLAKAQIPAVYSYLILGGLAVLFLYPLVEFFVKKKDESIFESFMESMVNILEIVMGYLANTVSFIRVGAFALAHAGLFVAIFQLSKIVKAAGGDLGAWVVIILGNILVICLEGLVVSIQSLRLNYYEFFSKFFLSGKYVYKPLTNEAV